jgi:hypothetical protein
VEECEVAVRDQSLPTQERRSGDKLILIVIESLRQALRHQQDEDPDPN